MEVELILFDWGGTLVGVDRQAEALHRGALEVARILAAPDPGDCIDELIRGILCAEQEAAANPTHREADLRAVLTGLVSSWGGPVAGDRLAAAGDAMGRAWMGSLDLVSGVPETVRCLRDRGYRSGLVSNCCIPPEYCRRELRRQGLSDLMKPAVFSSEVGYRKPSRIIYEEALRQAYPAGRPTDLSRVLFVGDSPVCDVIAPAAMGMKTALVNRPPGIWPDADYAHAQPDLRIDTVTQLPALLDRQ